MTMKKLQKPHLMALKAWIDAGTMPTAEMDAQILRVLVAPEGAIVKRSYMTSSWCVYVPAPDRSARPHVWDDSFWKHAWNGPSSTYNGAIALAVARDLEWSKGFDGEIRVRPIRDPDGTRYHHPAEGTAKSSAGRRDRTFPAAMVDAIVSAEIARLERHVETDARRSSQPA